MENPTTGQFCWNELAVSDVNKAKDFYGKVFGWQFTDVDTGGTTYTMITQKNDNMAGMWQIPTEQKTQIQPHWLSYILVDNVPQALETAKRNGAQIMRETTQVGDMGRLGIIIDPTGAPVGLWEPTQR
jgi:hypothetical protein